MLTDLPTERKQAGAKNCTMNGFCVANWPVNCADCGFNLRELTRRKELLRENGLTYDYNTDKRYLKITDDRWWNYGKH